MDLILLQKVTNLGGLGDKVKVKPGYGRNFLVPQGKAVPATAANVAEFEAKRAEYEAKNASVLADAESRKAALLWALERRRSGGSMRRSDAPFSINT